MKINYQKLESLCLSDQPYKEVKPEIYKIYDKWWETKSNQQLEDAELLLAVLQKVALQKSRLSNYILDRFLKDIADWGNRLYWQQDKWSEEKIERKALQLVDFAKKMLALIPRNKTKISDTLRSHILRLLFELSEWKARQEVLKIFLDSMTAMDTDEQFFALSGLEEFYAHDDQTLPKETINTLEEITKNTTVRENASNALDVLLVADAISQLTAVIRMDNWKSKNYR
jgi:hypothetical protein